MNFKAGLLPRKITDKRFLSASLEAFSYVVPAHIDRRTELLPCSNQGYTSKCAAYSIAGWLEYYNWKYYGVARQIDPNPIYKEAKKLDGAPDEDGTTLEAVLNAARNLGLITNVDMKSIREISYPSDIKQAIHRYGVVLTALNITDEWFNAEPRGWIPDGGNYIGGHAILACGYSDIESPNWIAVQNSWGDEQGWRGFNRLTPELFNEQFMYGLVFDFKR